MVLAQKHETDAHVHEKHPVEELAVEHEEESDERSLFGSISYDAFKDELEAIAEEGEQADIRPDVANLLLYTPIAVWKDVLNDAVTFSQLHMVLHRFRRLSNDTYVHVLLNNVDAPFSANEDDATLFFLFLMSASVLVQNHGAIMSGVNEDDQEAFLGLQLIHRLLFEALPSED